MRRLLLFVFLLQNLLLAQTLKIGSKKFTESVILGEIALQLATTQKIDVVHLKELGGTRILWQALLNGDIDMYPEYTGTLLQEILVQKKLGTVSRLKNYLKSIDIGMSGYLGFNNTYALGVTQQTAQNYNLKTISDLRDHPALRFGFSNEFLNRADGWPSLKAAYDLQNTENIRGLDHDLAYRGLVGNNLDVIEFYSTDAEINYYHLFVLKDNRHHFSEYQAVYLYRLDAILRFPALSALLKTSENSIASKTMSAMNADAKIKHLPVQRIAAHWVSQLTGIKLDTKEIGLWQRLVQRTAEHLFLVLISMFCAIVISLPLGVYAAFHKRAGTIVLGISGILQTIPSLALLVFMIPLLGIGEKPAIVALFLYSLLPIVRNTESGLKDIPQGIRDSAEAIGLSPTACLIHVYLPLASRSILGGIKTATVINIGTATLGALIGAGGYGQPILTGIRLDDMGLILEGAVPAALLALTAQWALGWLERKIG